MLGFKGIYMSPEDIFASQMWPWPEPALKRDSMGRVLFVNAAFLQMYGGQIEDWRGNIVTGWSAPQPPGMPYRFETRLPHESGEQVYDWMEFTLADGNAFAMARNVTYLFQAPDPDPGTQAQPPQAEPQMTAAETGHSADMSAPAPETAVPVFAEQLSEEPVLQVPAAEAPVVENYVEESHEAVDSISAEVAADPVFDSASYDNLTTPEMETDVEVPVVQEPVVDVVREEAPVERAYERRALPLENEDAVLGNNWRDAVIAKAVGAEVPKEEEAPAAQSDTPAPADESSVGPIRILLDMRMPNMDGLEATRKIRAMDNVSKGLPIIALTANAFDDDRNACFDSGMNDFMTKPVSAEELSEMVRTWTKNKAERDAA